MMTTLKSKFLLDPHVIFLNHGSFGACPQPVFEVYQAWQRRLELQPVLFLNREIISLIQEARQVLAAYLHTPADNLAFVPNATHGVNIIARSLALSKDAEILISDHEYGAMEYTWEFISKKTGANIVRQPIPLPVQSSTKTADRFWQGVTSRTKVIFLSHISSPTALKFPVEILCAWARQAGILTIIDGAHAPGQLALNIETIDADFYIGNCHKWMLSPKGSGFLYARPELQHLIEPLVVSWGYHATPQNTYGSPFLDYLSWCGTYDPAAYLSIPAAIRFMEEHHWDQVRSECHRLLHLAIERICALVNMAPLYPLDSDLYCQMGIAPLPADTNLEALKTRLYDEYHIEIPIMDWNGQKFIRISVQAYNTQEELNTLCNALQVMIKR